MDAAAATTLIKGLIEEADAVKRKPTNVDAWRRKCRTVLDQIFGEDSHHSQDLMTVDFQFYGICRLGDPNPEIQAFKAGVDKSKKVLRSFIWEIEQFGMPEVRHAEADLEESVAIVEQICNRFHAVVRQLRARHADRPTLDITDEYDVQDLMHSLLRLFFDDIRAEEWTPSYAGGSARMDFLLKDSQIVVELKKTRKGLDARKIGEELILDIAKYQRHPGCKYLICFVYDPENRIANPAGLEADLSRTTDGFCVKVVIAPMP
ncbi:MAG TPA: hypothetical protein VMP01_11110 [Pirellulaceae bacterium]|nr:hypothetical protein [Pirellulaceae bacterium]